MSRSDNLTGALLMMASMACFVVNDTMMKAMSGDVSLYQILFLRGILTSIAVALMAWKMGALTLQLPRRDAVLVFWRMCAEIGTAYFFLTALFNMPMANVMAILQASPLTITLCAAVLFGEPVGWRRLLAILVGFVGVMLIVRPGTDGFTIYSVYGLTAVACITVRDLTTRRLSPETPSMLVTLVTSVSVMVVFGLVSLGDEWTAMSARSSALTVGAAVFVIGGYLFSIMVMRVGEISFTAPFRYTGLIFALVLGWLVFRDWPDPLTLLGGAIVVGSGLFMLYREAVLGARTAASRGLRRH
ncbi:DMT family transporter [Roseovarius sp. 2305UL8-3]|uniref:DMT family transporter n=1 Tax=Roseovarius conchicola TaxID=3121636 RepID=UPI00352750D8